MEANRKLKVLIPNAPATSNMGDVAIFYGLLKVLEKSLPGAKITIHGMEPKKLTKLINLKVKPSLDYQVAFENPTFLARSIRVISMIFLALALGLLVWL